jgi:hypothetical protein
MDVCKYNKNFNSCMCIGDKELCVYLGEIDDTHYVYYGRNNWQVCSNPSHSKDFIVIDNLKTTKKKGYPKWVYEAPSFWMQFRLDMSLWCK